MQYNQRSSGFLHVVRGSWKVGDARVKEALDAARQQEFWLQFHGSDGFNECEQCPHEALKVSEQERDYD
jgi:hypothetical protein